MASLQNINWMFGLFSECKLQEFAMNKMTSIHAKRMEINVAKLKKTIFNIWLTCMFMQNVCTFIVSKTIHCNCVLCRGILAISSANDAALSLTFLWVLTKVTLQANFCFRTLRHTHTHTIYIYTFIHYIQLYTCVYMITTLTPCMLYMVTISLYTFNE